MSSKLNVLSGDDVVDILGRFGFEVFSQKGSHIKLRRTAGGVKETLVVPKHDPISKGTLKAIFNQASAYISQTDLRLHFYTK